MFKLQMKNDTFKVLNFADAHICSDELNPEHRNYKMIRKTIFELMERVKPDLVTFSGDQAWRESPSSYEYLASMMDGFNTPYAVVFGNHDQEGSLDSTVQVLKSHPLCIYEDGPSEHGRGNYLIGIYKNDKPIHALVMLDSHDHEKCKNDKGEDVWSWARLLPNQLEWYKEQIKDLKAQGFAQSSIIMHIPTYSYNLAFNSAFAGEKSNAISLAESYNPDLWNEGYKDSFGVKYEGICSFFKDEGSLDAIVEAGHTRDILVGHDHVNCFSVKYRGVRHTFSLKLGAGAYHNKSLNGGTVIEIDANGQTQIKHESVDILEFFND